MRARHSERTGKILLALTKKPMTAGDLAKTMKCRLGTTRATLLRLFRFGQVVRERIEDKENPVLIDKDEDVWRSRFNFRYSITQKGHDRLQRLAER